jgi:hypothetical protein
MLMVDTKSRPEPPAPLSFSGWEVFSEPFVPWAAVHHVLLLRAMKKKEKERKKKKELLPVLDGEEGRD